MSCYTEVWAICEVNLVTTFSPPCCLAPIHTKHSVFVEWMHVEMLKLYETWSWLHHHNKGKILIFITTLQKVHSRYSTDKCLSSHHLPCFLEHTTSRSIVSWVFTMSPSVLRGEDGSRMGWEEMVVFHRLIL